MKRFTLVIFLAFTLSLGVFPAKVKKIGVHPKSITVADNRYTLSEFENASGTDDIGRVAAVADIAAAIALLDGHGGIIQVENETQVYDDLTIPSNVRLVLPPTAVFNVAATKTLTLNCYTAGTVNSTGSGTVAYGSSFVNVATTGAVLGSGDITFDTGLSGGADINHETAVAATAGQTLDLTGQAGGTAATGGVGKDGGAITLTAGAGSAKNGAGANDGNGGDVVFNGGAKGGSTAGTEINGMVKIGAPTLGTITAPAVYDLGIQGKMEVDGNVAMDAGLSVTGGTVNLNASSNNAVNIGTGTTTSTVTIGGAGTQQIDIGNGAAAKAVNIGSDNGASATVIKGGTGDVSITSVNDLTLNGGSAGSIITIGGNTHGNTIAIGGDDTAADAIAIGSAKDALTMYGVTVDIQSTAVASTINLGGGAAAQTVNVGSTNTTSTTAINSGSGGIALNGTVTGNGTINATTFDTNVAAAAVTLAGTTLAADGTDSAINIAITPKGTGEVDITKVDIDAGTIDGTDVTVGAGKTLDVSAGTLTLADNQISGDKVEGGTIAATTITSLTSTTITTGGAGTAAATGNVATENALGTVHSTVLTLTDVDIAPAAAGAGIAFDAVKLYTFPEGYIYYIGAVGDLALTDTISAGAEMAGNFATWTPAGNWSYASDKWSHTTGDATGLTTDVVPVAGTTYTVTVTMVTTTAGGGLVISMGGVSQSEVHGSATESWTFTASDTTALVITPAAGTWEGDVTAVTVNSVTPVSATWNGDISIGTTADADGSLAGTEVDLIPKTATPAAVAGAATADCVSTATEFAIHDGHSAAKELHLNLLVDAGDFIDAGTGALHINGTVTITWIRLGDN